MAALCLLHDRYLERSDEVSLAWYASQSWTSLPDAKPLDAILELELRFRSQRACQGSCPGLEPTAPMIPDPSSRTTLNWLALEWKHC